MALPRMAVLQNPPRDTTVAGCESGHGASRRRLAHAACLWLPGTDTFPCIDSKPAGVLASTFLKESGTLRIPATSDFTDGVKILRDLTVKKVSFKGALKTSGPDSADVDTTKKTTVSGGDYGLNFKVSLEDLTSLFSPASSKHPKISAEFIDRNALKDLNRPSYVSKGNGFVSVPQSLFDRVNPAGTYIASEPSSDDPDFSWDLSEGSTFLVRTTISKSGLTTHNSNLAASAFSGPMSNILNKFIALSGKLRMDNTFGSLAEAVGPRCMLVATGDCAATVGYRGQTLSPVFPLSFSHQVGVGSL